MEKTSYLMVLIGMGIVTYLPRWLPLIFLSRRQLPQLITKWLDYIPVSILSALTVPTLLLDVDSRSFNLFKPELLASIPTLIIAMKTKSLAWTIMAGMILFWITKKMIL